jgi:hypothetical protein
MKNNSTIFLVFVVTLALILRLPGISDSFWLDEAAQALESVRPWYQQFDIVDDFQPPLLHLIVHLAQYFSHSEWWLRTWAALLPGLITVIMTFLIGKKVFSPMVGGVAALFTATSSLMTFYSQELRPYALPMCFATISWYWLIQQRYLSKKESLGFIIVSAAGLYSSYLYPFLFLTQLLFLPAITSAIRKQIIILMSVTGLLFAFWIPMFLQQLNAGQNLRNNLPGWELVVSTPQLKSLPLIVGKFFYGVLEIDLSVTYLIPIMILFVILATNFFLLIKKSNIVQLKTILGLMLWGVASILIAWLISFFVPVLQPKRVLFALPAIYLFMSYFLLAPMELIFRKKNFALLKPRHYLLNVFALAILLSINVFGLSQYYTRPKLQRENWRDLITEVKANYPENETALIVAFPEPFAPMRWYSHDYTTFSIEYLNDDSVPDLAAQLRPIVEYKYILTFDYLSDLTDPKDMIVSTVASFGFREVDRLDYPNIGFVRVFSKSESITAYASWN